MVEQQLFASIDAKPRRAALAMLALATTIASVGLAAGGTAGTLLAEKMVGTDAAAGLSVGLLVAGSAVTALVISRQAGRIGWGRSLMLGYVLGAIGGMLVIIAAIAGSFGVLLVGNIMLGAANSSVFLTRYVAAEVAGEAGRGRALGAIYFATAIGAVASPSLLGPGGALAHAIGLPPLSGLYMIAVVSSTAAALLVAAMSHPAMPYIGNGAALFGPSSSAHVALREIASGLKAIPPRIALVVLATSNLIMVGIMAIVPVHMAAMSNSLQITGMVVSVHVAGMFAPSPITGWLADRVGPVPVALTGILLLTTAGATGIFIGQHDAFSMGLMVIILGLGWNCGAVGGSVLLAASVPGALRPHIEGIGEVTMGVAAAMGAPIAGVIAAHGGIPALSMTGASVALFVLAFVSQAMRRGLGRGSLS
ncbi:MAG TPA: MFS transporter [Ktedonobacterales bacterium]